MKATLDLVLRVGLLVVGVAMAGACATSGNQPATAGDPGAGTSTDDGMPGPEPRRPGKIDEDPELSRGQAAMQGVVVGGMVGTAVGGPVGGAAGAVIFGVYGAVTGESPMGPGGGGRQRPGPRDERGRDAELERELERELGREVAQQETLESAIEQELRRQEELLKEIDRREAEKQIAANGGVGASGTRAAGSIEADPRVAPAAPRERELPPSIYEEAYQTIAAGTWENRRSVEVLTRSLDADRDGSPEEIRYHDGDSGSIIRKETDRDFDGRIDSWTLYEAGLVAEIREDNDGDGEPDEWQQYGADGRMALREVDRDGDGVRDAFYVYEAGSLIVERHDGDSNGALDRIVYYRERKLDRTEEDADKDGTMDTWTRFEAVDEEEFIAAIERDADGEGTRDVFEIYEQVDGRTYLKRRDEDRNNDGEIDVSSVYEKGKLRGREIRDPELVPL